MNETYDQRCCESALLENEIVIANDASEQRIEVIDGEYADKNHSHDDNYAPKDHSHEDEYADKGHNHDEEYAGKNHNHDGRYATGEHSHSEYANKTQVIIHRWGSDD